MRQKNESPQQAQAWWQPLGPSQGMQHLRPGDGAWLPPSPWGAPTTPPRRTAFL